MSEHAKLVRDRIPEIIEASGKHAVTRTLDDDELARRLDLKLLEELTEFYDSGDIIELVDLVEIIAAIASSTVAGKNCASFCVTGSPSASEFPRSPRAASPK